MSGVRVSLPPPTVNKRQQDKKLAHQKKCDRLVKLAKSGKLKKEKVEISLALQSIRDWDAGSYSSQNLENCIET
jgi:hypothetical protein